MAKTSIANSESGSSVRTKLNASDIRPEATLINIDAAGDQTIDCGTGIRLYDTITANRTIGTISNLTLPTILDIDGAFTVDFSAALKADSNNDFYGNNVLTNGENYIIIAPKEAGGIIVTYSSGIGEAVNKASSVALGAAIDWSDGTFQPVTGSGAEAITSITSPSLGTIYITITGGSSCSVVVTGLTFLKKNVFNPNESVNVLKITCIDSLTPVYHAEWISTPIQVLEYALSDETTVITTGAAKLTFRMPFAAYLVDVRASLNVASTGTIYTLDINETGVTVLSTKLTIDIGEKTSTTAVTTAVISDASIADDAEMTIDVDTAGTLLAGGKIKLYVRRL